MKGNFIHSITFCTIYSLGRCICIKFVTSELELQCGSYINASGKSTTIRVLLLLYIAMFLYCVRESVPKKDLKSLGTFLSEIVNVFLFEFLKSVLMSITDTLFPCITCTHTIAKTQFKINVSFLCF